ncbi:flagellar biosynthesis protein FlhF [Anaerocolumna aminovalerica]|uniref:Flagellar biosynthesis protein FlhF n=1 Tax=Anaerocolumna aminovalerica TaxID=1527 RepID=A0A1I5I4D3_9FIRM|nr:flagellar biosynthesis protein FlhF [Anaerocolumna aminovalerica]SFO55498.1 flagellar biosynthesis protein FlhF [Anaerocolumna aminovalerica]
MIIKKFQGNTETEAIMLAKEELGKDAIVMNIKTITPKGIYKLFRSPIVEITAAMDDTNLPSVEKKELVSEKTSPKFSAYVKDNLSDILQEDKENSTTVETSAIEKKLNSLQELLEKQLNESRTEQREDHTGQWEDHTKQWEPHTKQWGEKEDIKADEKETANKNLSLIQLVYNQLLHNEVDEKFINQILGEIENKYKKDTTLDNLLANVYQKIILKLGQPKTIELEENKTKVIFFIGPTGVGKTTTIAKIASTLKLNKKAKVAMVTSDTYRIAAVEQLRTYANILSVPMQVIYTPEEMETAREEFKDYDVVLVDTAGRSHKSAEQRTDLDKLIHSVEEDVREVYLVMSATTKYADLVRITEAYSEIANYRVIFTKLDETGSIGNVLNIRMLTGADLSYTTCGQNVPDDIGKLDTQETAKQLLGGSD